MMTETGAIRNLYVCFGLSLCAGLAAYPDALGPAPTHLPAKLDMGPRL